MPGELDTVFPEGVGGSRVELVKSGALAAIVSRVPDEGVRVRRQDLRRHLAVLEEAFRAMAVLPCRFGTVVEDESSLRAAVLEGRRDELEAGLRRLTAKTQMNVKAVYDEQEVLRRIMENDPRLARLRAQVDKLGDAAHFARIQLGEEVVAALRLSRQRDAAHLVERLTRCSEEIVAEEVADELTVLKASCLVGDTDAFERVLDDLARENAPVLRLESIGPLPPTAFAAEATGLGG